MSSDGSYQLIANQSDIETDPLYSEISRFAHFYSVGGLAIHSAAQIGGKFCKVGIIVRVLLIPGSDGMHEGRCSMTKYGAPWNSLVLRTWCSTNSDSLWKHTFLSLSLSFLWCAVAKSGAAWKSLVLKSSLVYTTNSVCIFLCNNGSAESVGRFGELVAVYGGWVASLQIVHIPGAGNVVFISGGEPSDGIVGKGRKYAIAEEDRRQNLNCNLEEKLQRGIYKESVYRVTVSKKKQREACTTSLFTHGQSQGLQSLKKKVRW